MYLSIVTQYKRMSCHCTTCTNIGSSLSDVVHRIYTSSDAVVQTHSCEILQTCLCFYWVLCKESCTGPIRSILTKSKNTHSRSVYITIYQNCKLLSTLRCQKCRGRWKVVGLKWEKNMWVKEDTTIGSVVYSRERIPTVPEFSARLSSLSFSISLPFFRMKPDTSFPSTSFSPLFLRICRRPLSQFKTQRTVF